MDDDLGRNKWRSSHLILGIFAGIVAIAIMAAFAATIHGIDTRQAHDDFPPGTIGLARPHPPLDKGPAEPVR
jgi:uncharacterized iron-regulated membrane protein